MNRLQIIILMEQMSKISEAHLALLEKADDDGDLAEFEELTFGFNNWLSTFRYDLNRAIEYTHSSPRYVDILG